MRDVEGSENKAGGGWWICLGFERLGCCGDGAAEGLEGC